MRFLLALCLCLSGCLDEEASLPIVNLSLPVCLELGCEDPTAADRACAVTGACACQPGKEAPQTACAATCALLACERLVCDEHSLCTCVLEDGTGAACAR